MWRGISFLTVCCFISIMSVTGMFDSELDHLRLVPLVVVEGKKDIAALEVLGVKNIFALNRQPLHEVVDGVSALSDEAALLVDLDREGKKLYAQLSAQFCRVGVRVNNRFRMFLFKETPVRHIEGLLTYYTTVNSDLKFVRKVYKK